MNLRAALAILCGIMSANSPAADSPRPVIYQLFVRHFGNLNETRKPGGTLAENGVGKFADLNAAALDSLRALGVTHLWLTGVLQQATRTDYSALGQPADDPDICKGEAGSPYAIKDYFDVCPDYATDPAQRLEEFQALLARCHAHGLKTMIDFVANHVSRAYRSDIRPELSFGAEDDRGQFFARDNNFFYLRQGAPPLRLPTAGRPGCDGLFDGEMDFGRVTGNNAATWSPGPNDWYETVKLNYGWNFLLGRPGDDAFRADAKPPRTWAQMESILAYWQGFGVDGFRCDMAHMIPMAFWREAIAQARGRDAGVLFVAEAYDNDPTKLTDGNVHEALLGAGFDAVYDDPSYKVVKGIYDDGKWANDLDALINNGAHFHHSLRYAENHDEVRLASARNWQGVGGSAGPAVSAILFGLGRGPIMLYNGQETGEPALGAEGYGGDDGRTTIFDYWSLPTLQGWVNGHRYDGAKLSPSARDLRARYAALLGAISDANFQTGLVTPLNDLNRDNPDYGRIENETVSGHWLFSYLRGDISTGNAALVVVNLHPTAMMNSVGIAVPAAVEAALISGSWEVSNLLPGDGSAAMKLPHTSGEKVTLPLLAPLTAQAFRLRRIVAATALPLIALPPPGR